MGEAMITRRGGGGKLNAIVEQYRVAAGGSVSANGFVKFVDGQSQHSLTGAYTRVSAAALNEQTIIAAYGSGNAYYANVVTLNNLTETVGTKTQIGTKQSESVPDGIKVFAISSTRALAIYKYSGTSYAVTSEQQNYAVITANSGAITVEKQGTWASTSTEKRNRNYDFSDVKLDVGMNNGSGWYRQFKLLKLDASTPPNLLVHSYVVNASGATLMSTGTAKLLTEKEMSSEDMEIQHNQGIYGCPKVSDDKYVIVHGIAYKNMYGGVTGRVCSISAEGQITLGTRKYVVASGNVYYTRLVGAIALDNSRVLTIYTKNKSVSSPGYMYGRVCECSGETLTIGTETQLGSQQYVAFSYVNNVSNQAYAMRDTYGGISARGSNVWIICHPNAKAETYLTKLTISGNEITPETTTVFLPEDSALSSAGTYCDVACIKGKPVVYATVSGDAKGTRILDVVTAATTIPVDGVAKSSGSAGEIVNVYRPE